MAEQPNRPRFNPMMIIPPIQMMPVALGGIEVKGTALGGAMWYEAQCDRFGLKQPGARPAVTAPRIPFGRGARVYPAKAPRRKTAITVPANAPI